MIVIMMILLLVSGRAGYALQFADSSRGLDTLEFGGSQTEVEVGDLNGDGCPDLVTIGDHGAPYVGGEGGIMVYEGNCMGRWHLVQSPPHFGFGGMAIGDVNNDGWLDVGYGMHHYYDSSGLGNRMIIVALGDGSDSNWTGWSSGLAENGETWGMFGTDFADVDNDGDLDLAVAPFGAVNGPRVYLNNLDGTWSQSFSLPPTNSMMDISFGDVNRDGHADLAMSFQSGSIYFGDGSGGFVWADYNLPGADMARTSVRLGDVDGDGGMDVAFVYWSGANRDIKWPQVWRFDPPSGIWQNLSANLVAGPYWAVELSDLNNDGKADLIAARSNGSYSISDIQIFLRDTAGGGSWTLEDSTIPIDRLYRMRWMQSGVDVDHNGHADIVMMPSEGPYVGGQNHLHSYVEMSDPVEPMLVPVRPNGAEVWQGGSIHTIRWHSGNPSRQPDPVRLELSLTGEAGPWRLIADEVVDNGAYQWRVADSVQSTHCFIRYSNRALAVSRSAFEIRATTSTPQLAVSAETLDFGRVVLGEDSSRTFRVINVGSAELTGTVQSPTGVFECPEGCGEIILAPAAEQIVVIRFAPADTLLYEDTILVESSGGSAVVHLTGGGTPWSSIGDSRAAPGELALHRPYPNPFNATVRLSYDLPAGTAVRICAWNLLGEMVQELASGFRPAGSHTLSIDAGCWASGLYFFSLETSSSVQVQKALLLK
jgi:hypothetical protein